MECHAKNHRPPVLELCGSQILDRQGTTCKLLPARLPEVSRSRALKENSYSVIPLAALLDLADAVVVVVLAPE